jgi:hypothetical protein
LAILNIHVIKYNAANNRIKSTGTANVRAPIVHQENTGEDSLKAIFIRKSMNEINNANSMGLNRKVRSDLLFIGLIFIA